MNLSTAVVYPPKTCDRAARALRCSPFTIALLLAMETAGIPLQALTGQAAMAQGYTRKPLLDVWAESEMLWLIQVGLVRREVDGQGITDSFRLTPLGRQFSQDWQQQGIPAASWGDRLLNFLQRWLRWPA
ncbi:hypothetical protein VB712_14195 [Spirulina sp. CCNP1310]|uniref:Npun_F0494 family protein n=1 Tax=Spirulina sp. CCNP1310 TaxID=3110249 RepID=UPI002B1F49C8|nr:Npun_F0494 family protein [Spirulina sp. CCNP1310]MEA5420379.1 hypothetical protein [Spirulina sp. CCNP1310]